LAAFTKAYISKTIDFYFQKNYFPAMSPEGDEATMKKENLFLIPYSVKRKKIKIYNELIGYINLFQPFTFEISSFSKFPTFTLNDNDNLIDKLYNDKN
jgi:hypothetical protein